MTFQTSDYISILSLVVAIFSAFFAARSSSQSTRAANDNLRLQNGMLELEVRQSIENAKSKVNDICVIMAPLVSKKNDDNISISDKLTLDSYEKSFNAFVETMINTYDDACSKYADNKIDKERFKKNYKTEIKNLVENSEFECYFRPVTSKYKTILNVYREWED